jgi:Crinkler effector protein N-terminal domain
MAEKLLLFVYVIYLHSYTFPIEFESSQTVGHLREAILWKYPNNFKNIDNDRLILYRTEFYEGDNLRQLAELADKSELVLLSHKLSKIFPIQPPEETVNILVYVPGGVVSSTMADAGRPELWPSITIKAVQGSFGRAALAPNGISEFLGTEPEFLNEFRSKLRQRRRIQSDAVCLFFDHIPVWSLKVVTGPLILPGTHSRIWRILSTRPQGR